MKTYKELKTLNLIELDKYIESLTEEDQETLLNSLVEELSDDDHYFHKIYSGPGCYFTIASSGILEISDEVCSYPRGGWFPAIVTGISEEEQDAVDEIIEKYDADGELTDLLEEICDYMDEEFDDDEVLEAYKDEDETDFLNLYKELMFAVKSAGDVFESVCDFVHKYNRRDLEEDTLYYEWEGDYIDFLDNILMWGEKRGYFESNSAAEWIRKLLDLDDSIVTPIDSVEDINEII